MPESGTSGSVRGARSNGRPYRDKIAWHGRAILVLRRRPLAHAVRRGVTAWAKSYAGFGVVATVGASILPTLYAPITNASAPP